MVQLVTSYYNINHHLHFLVHDIRNFSRLSGGFIIKHILGEINGVVDVSAKDAFGGSMLMFIME